MVPPPLQIFDNNMIEPLLCMPHTSEWRGVPESTTYRYHFLGWKRALEMDGDLVLLQDLVRPAWNLIAKL